MRSALMLMTVFTATMGAAASASASRVGLEEDRIVFRSGLGSSDVTMREANQGDPISSGIVFTDANQLLDAGVGCAAPMQPLVVCAGHAGTPAENVWVRLGGRR